MWITENRPCVIFVHLFGFSHAVLRDVDAIDFGIFASQKKAFQRCTATTSDVEHRHAVVETDKAKPPFVQWRMAEVHKLQHCLSHSSLWMGALCE